MTRRLVWKGATPQLAEKTRVGRPLPVFHGRALEGPRGQTPGVVGPAHPDGLGRASAHVWCAGQAPWPREGTQYGRGCRRATTFKSPPTPARGGELLDVRAAPSALTGMPAWLARRSRVRQLSHGVSAARALPASRTGRTCRDPAPRTGTRTAPAGSRPQHVLERRGAGVPASLLDVARIGGSNRSSNWSDGPGRP